MIASATLFKKPVLSEINIIKTGIMHTYFGWWDGVHQANINKLIGDYVSDIGYGTAFQNCLVEIMKKNRGRFSVPNS
ncbi:hypothetical protein ES708_34132 [subsurface metagenome]